MAWSCEKCKQKFISSVISFRELAKISGVPLGTLSRWSSKDSQGTWVKQRDAYQNTEVSIVSKNALVVETVEQQFSEELSPDFSIEIPPQVAETINLVYDSNKNYLDYVNRLIKIRNEYLQEQEQEYENNLKDLYVSSQCHKEQSANYLGLCLERASKQILELDAAMFYIKTSAAYQWLKKLGYDIRK